MDMTETESTLVGIDVMRLVLLCRGIDKFLATRSGMRLDELHCLCVIYLERPSCVKELNDTLCLCATRTSKVLRRLEDRGFITRSHRFEDHRKELLSLTEVGKYTAQKLLSFCVERAALLSTEDSAHILDRIQSHVKRRMN
jgi:DNA-binding MarR family transcriptional regulator